MKKMEGPRRIFTHGWLPLVFLINLAVLWEPTKGDDVTSLLAFKSAVDTRNQLRNWNRNTNVCQWTGIKCTNGTSGRVHDVRIPGSGLVGPIPDGTIGGVEELRVLSLRMNRLSGPFPADFLKLKQLRSLFIQSNNFSGPLPSDFTALPSLVRLNVAFNNFDGEIPVSLSNLSRLATFYAQNNNLTGDISSLSLPKIAQFSVANNNLNGTVPTELRKFGAGAFSGTQICGPPLARQCPAVLTPSPAPVADLNPAPVKKKSKKLSTGAVIGIAVGAAVLAFAILLLLFFACCRRKRDPTPKATDRSIEPKGEEVNKEERPGFSAGETEKNKLVFFEGAPYKFDLEDLLRASAEVLGKGSVGTAYKAVLEDGAVVAVKRLKDISISSREFEQQIQLIGRLQHPNLVPLRAYYFSKDEKLLVYDYMPMGSLSALLHGSRGAGRTPLDWVSRVRIALGAARGITYLHDQGGINGGFVHGNIKSSNILLKKNYDACVSDFGLTQLFNSSSAASRIVGYRAPEVAETRKSTQRSDVYSFGVLLLELLTGKPPTQASLNDEGIDLPRWVQSVVREEWTAEVFDLELMRYQNIEEEMVQLLQVAMSCVVTSPDQRPRMRDVVRMIEDIRVMDTDDSRMPSDKSEEKSNGHTSPYNSHTPGSDASQETPPKQHPQQ